MGAPMTAGWHFGKASPDQKAREPQVEKFFGADVVSNLATALVREGIQNSLDARDGDAARVSAGEPVRVRVRLSSVPAAAAKAYAAGLWEHLSVQEDEHLPGRPKPADVCRYLAFEDFNTRGLQGNPEQVWSDEDPKNAFFNFFRAEGHSGKQGSARGRHGLGKHVFARASRARCFYGLTERADGRRLLMGAGVLRIHKVKEVRYVPDGWFGMRREADGFALPVEDVALLAGFTKTFGLARTPGQAGLSIVVPWLDETINRPEVLAAVLRGYFYPILTGQLVVAFAGDGGADFAVDAGSLPKLVERHSPELRAELEPLLALTTFAMATARDTMVATKAPATKPAWTAELLPADLRAALQERMQAGDPVALRVPVKVRRKAAGSADELSHFDVFMRRDPSSDDERVVFVREGLIIADARPRPTPGVRALVVIDGGPLATFLGDAENPAHTQWQKSMVEGKYTWPEDRIRFVVQAVPQVLRFLAGDQQKPDPSLWLDLFSVPADEPVFKVKKGGKDPGVGPPPPDPTPPPPPAPKKYRIDWIDGGFAVRPGKPGAERPLGIAVRVAYDVRDGKAKWDAEDFQLDQKPIVISLTGAEVDVGPTKDHMLVRPKADDFEVRVVGFDPYRDLILDPKLLTATADGSTGEDHAEEDDAEPELDTADKGVADGRPA